VLIAGTANIFVGLIKLVAGVLARRARPGAAAGDRIAGLGRRGVDRHRGLLVVVAVRLGLDSRDFLIGRAADPKELETIRAVIENAPGVDELLDLRTMHVGPDHLIVAAQVAFSDEISADRAEDVADDIDRRLADRLPQVAHVFLDPTQTPSAAPGRAR
jgi:divalent metal cation (Fe/Co/Zn/Cd) transporter